VWLTFAIREGKNREVRNVLGHLGLQVNRLIRVAFGPFELGDLRDGGIEEIETTALREQLGESLAREAGCDFTSPVFECKAEPRSRDDRRKERYAERRAQRGLDRPRDKREFAPRGGRGDTPEKPFRSRTFHDDRPEKPPGRPRRGHAWRQEDAPLRRTYRGSRRDDLKIPDEARPDKRAGLLKDRKGRRILVERFGTKKPKPVPPERPAPARLRTPRRPPRDRSGGPRPSRPRPPDGKR
jgi:23S rRNA pseudouridine2605 synthase